MDATTQVHAGFEYLWILERTVLPLRAGIFLDPEPAEDMPQNFWGLSFGTGVSIGSLVFDLAYQFRYATSVKPDVVHLDNDVLSQVGSLSGSVQQHLMYLSAIQHF